MIPDQTILDFEDALACVRAEAARLATPAAIERLPLLEAQGRVLAEPVLADRDQPPFDRSARDGYAVRASDLADAASLQLLGEVRAGSRWDGEPLRAGQAIQIMTGAPLPAGADAVLMREHADRSASAVSAAAGPTLHGGDHVVPQGSEARSGASVLAAASVLGPAELALAASCGYATLSVYARPRVAIVATGDELVEVDQTPRAEQIRNSNSYALSALVSAAGGAPDRLPITPDERAATSAAIKRARQADLIALSGGVSMGEYDLVEEALLAAGAEFLFTGVRMQPGRPVVFGSLPPLGTGGAPTYFFGLPGNPISVQVTFQCFAAPLLRALAGEREAAPRWAQAKLSEAVTGKPELTRLLPAKLSGIHVAPVGWRGSGDLTANARGNCYAELLPGRTYAAGDLVRVLLR